MSPCLRGDPAGRLRATSIIDWLGEQHPGRFSASQLRTLQRRLQDWRALNGPDQEVYFPREHPPGREAQIDFNHGNPLGVTIASQPYPHLLFQLILSHSGWRYAEVATGETFLALQKGIQSALWTLGEVPQVERSDNTSAATHEVRRSRALNDAYASLLDHYVLRSTRINRGQSHENGVAEQGHYRLKDAINQALICGAAGISTPSTTTPASSGRWSKDAIVWSRESWSRKWLAWGPCPQLPCRNTSTTRPGCTSGTPSSPSTTRRCAT